MFVLVYTNQDPNSKRFNARKDIKILTLSLIEKIFTTKE